MPAAVPLIATAAFNAAGAAILGTTVFGLSVAASAAVIGLGSLALGLVSNALTPKPKRPAINGMDGSRTFQVRQPTPPREVVYGEIKKSGYLVLAENTDNNNYVHYVVTIASHEVDAINTVYINDTPVFNDQINGSGAVTAGKFAGKLWIKKHLGADDQVADADLIADITGLDSNFRLRGVAYIYVKHKTDRDLFPNGANIAARVAGDFVEDIAALVLHHQFKGWFKLRHSRPLLFVLTQHGCRNIHHGSCHLNVGGFIIPPHSNLTYKSAWVRWHTDSARIGNPLGDVPQTHLRLR